MNDSASQLGYLRDSRLSAHAVGTAPAWLWSADATRILWANAVGAAIFEAAAPAQLANRRFEANDIAAQQIARIAGNLPLDGVPRLERLSGFGAEPSHKLTCGCSRISLSDGTAAILVVAAEAAGPALSLEERVQRLVAGIDMPVAVFSAEGTLFHAEEPAAGRLAAASTLEVLGADALATHALRAGYASGASKIGAISIERIGNDAATFLVVTLPNAQRAEPQAAQPAQPPAPIVQQSPPAPPAETEADVFVPETAMDEEVFNDSKAEPIAPAPAVAPAAADPAMPERRQPLRFVWQMDASGRFTIESGDFVRLTGTRTAEVLGLHWSDIVRHLNVDPQGQVAQAIATRDTWSGITIDWPVDGTDERLAVELSGLPVFDRERAFGGYRGFGVCRDARRISLAVSLRHPAGNTPAPAVPKETKPPASEERPVLTVVPQAENVVPFRSANGNDRTPSLSPVERSAFRELAKELTSRLQENNGSATDAPPAENDDFEGQPAPGTPISDDNAYGRAGGEANAMGFVQPREPAAAAPLSTRQVDHDFPPFRDDRTILDRLPMGVLVYRLDTPLYGNPAFLEWSGYDTVAALTSAGGLDVLFVESGGAKSEEPGNHGQPLRITSNRGKQQPADGRLFTALWEGEAAHVLMLLPAARPARISPPSDAALGAAEAEARELKTILDTATDGVLVLDGEGRILAASAGSEALFGRDGRALTASTIVDLIAPESQRVALDCLAEMTREGGPPKSGREVIGRGRDGGLLPLFMTLGRLGDGKRFCAVFQNLTPWKKTEVELVTARRQAEKASSAKSEFLAKVSHEIRTPLNSIIGFSEVMMDERFGPIANDRYKQYLKDIHESGGHLVSLLNDLLDLSKIEAGKLDLSFGSVSLNDLTQQCVSLMQPQANQERVIIRTSLPNVLPQIMADARSVRQIVLNLLSNSIKFTGAGGQVIVSTAHTDDGEVVLRVRDTGLGMTEKEIQMALEPFRQLATSSRWGSGGTGLGLPLTKALAEANRANFSIKSAVNAGTLVEVSFPSTRVLVA
jgi:PAS domain S-box-containing protein